jgi:hypothetical protein
MSEKVGIDEQEGRKRLSLTMMEGMKEMDGI